MTARKNVKTDETNKQPAMPETLDDIKTCIEVLHDLPDLTPPNKLNVRQSGETAVTYEMVREAFTQMQEDKDSDLTVTAAVSYINEKMDAWMRLVVKDESKYDEWAQGREPFELAGAFIALIGFYKGELGKSRRSAKPTSDAESN